MNINLLSSKDLYDLCIMRLMAKNPKQKENRAKQRTNLYDLKETFTYGKREHFCGECCNRNFCT